MKDEQKKSVLSNIASIKKELMMLRIKASSGEIGVLKGSKQKRKEIARLFTKLNSKLS